MSDTPETDKNTWSDSSEGILYKVVTSDFARKLERERDEARDTVEQLTKHGLDLMDANRILKRERGEAIQRRMETISQCELLQKERDEAREKLEEEIKWHHRTHQELVECQCKLLDMEYDKLKS